LDQFLFNLILGNALSNTTMHGKKGGNVEIDVFKVFQKTPNTNSQRFCVTLVNEPGDKHAQNLQIQAEMGDNNLLDAGTKSWSSQIGCDTSTFLGLSEMKKVSKLMGADLSLEFEDSAVTLTIEMEMMIANPITSEPKLELPCGTVFICADDDLPARLHYESLLSQKLLGQNVNLEASMVVGETYTEASNIVPTVLEVQQRVANCVALQMHGLQLSSSHSCRKMSSFSST